MSHNDTTRYDSTVNGISNGDSGQIHLPAQVQRDLGICIDDMVEVTLSDLDHEFIESISFENKQTAGDNITVPAHIMRDVGLEAGQSVTAEFAVPDDDSGSCDDDAEGSDLGQSPGAQDSDDESLSDFEELVEETTPDDESEEESEGLGELFA